MARPMQTPNQGLTGDSLTVLAQNEVDSTKLLATGASVVPGFPAVMWQDDAKLHSTMDSSGVSAFYGVFTDPISNPLYSTKSMGEYNVLRAGVLLSGRILLRDAVYLENDGVTEVTVSPWVTEPTAADIGSSVYFQSTVDAELGTILKFDLVNTGPVTTGPVGQFVGISDDASEWEVRIYGNSESYTA